MNYGRLDLDEHVDGVGVGQVRNAYGILVGIALRLVLKVVRSGSGWNYVSIVRSFVVLQQKFHCQRLSSHYSHCLATHPVISSWTVLRILV